MPFLLFTGDTRPIQDDLYSGSVVEPYETIEEAKNHLGNREWGIVAYIGRNGYRLETQTVAYYNVLVGPNPISDKWVDIKSA